jgi:hypothetical protein
LQIRNKAERELLKKTACPLALFTILVSKNILSNLALLMKAGKTTNIFLLLELTSIAALYSNKWIPVNFFVSWSSN